MATATDFGRVGFVGLGAMGSRMATNMAKAGVDLICYDAAGTADRAPMPAEIACGIAEVAAKADIVFLSLPDGEASKSVSTEIATTNDRCSSVIIDTSTIGIEAAQSIYNELAQHSVTYIDAPVSGGIKGASSGTVALMFAGENENFKRLQPLLITISKHLFYVGSEAGQGQAMKLLNNFLSGLALTATSEAISFGARHGLTMKMMIDVLNLSSGQNTATSDKFPNRILTKTYDAEFLNNLYLKDLSLYVENAEAVQCSNIIGKALLPIWQRFVKEQPVVDFTKIYPFVNEKNN